MYTSDAAVAAKSSFVIALRKPMTPYSALSLTLLGLAFLAPALAGGFLILACLPHTRRLSARFLVWSAVGGAIVCGAVYVTVSFSGRTEITPILGLALFGTGFSLGAFSLSIWLILRQVLYSKLMQPTGQERPAAD